MRLALMPLLCSLALPAAAEEHLMLVLDASGSMWGQIDGRSKVEIARETVAGVLRDWPPGDQLGLVAYGHRRKGDCGDIETLIPVGPLDAAAYQRTVDGLNALGMTPLSAAVQHAAQALKSSERKATVVLVSDGEETCDLDPCAVGAALEKSGVDFTAHVIGFDVSNPHHQAQLRCLAENTGGRYFNARDAVELSAAIGGAVSASVEAAPPPATATLAVDAPLRIAQPAVVQWSGPADAGDYITFVPPGAEPGTYLDYAMLKPVDGGGQGSAELQAPATAGRYELRYESPIREQSILARIEVTVGDIAASIDAPAEAMAGMPITARATGPAGGRHWIGFAPKDSAPGTYLDFEYVDRQTRDAQGRFEVTLMPPSEPGDYELRYVLDEHVRVLVTHPIRVIAAQASISGPATAMAGDRIAVHARGPVGTRHWIGFAPAGSGAGTYRHYVRPEQPDATVQLDVPTEPGAYELRYVLNESEKVIAAQPITVVPAAATISAPATASPGQAVAIAFDGPRGSGGWIGFVPRGGDGSSYFAYVSIDAATASPQTLPAPDAAGAYDLVYFNDHVMARHAIEVR